MSSNEMLDRGSDRNANVILDAVDLLCTLLLQYMSGNDRALSSTVWQNAQSQAAWQA
ncbi:hypothetical protein IW139_004288, partial [Coemansia sp. RSA 353]